MPWGLEDKSVTWFSSNESVVQVEDGVVTALAEGSATIQAVTKAEPHLEAACTVTVAEAEVRFSALVRNETGSQWTEFSTDNLSAASSFGSAVREPWSKCWLGSRCVRRWRFLGCISRCTWRWAQSPRSMC